MAKQKIPTLKDLWAIQDLAKRLAVADIIYQSAAKKNPIDLTAYKNAINSEKEVSQKGIIVATIKLVDKVDDLEELPEFKRNNIKLLFLAAGHQLLQKAS